MWVPEMKIFVVIVLVLVVFLTPSPVATDEAQTPPEDFVPSEKVSADRSISFPVDI